jgi:hypothetical protein
MLPCSCETQIRGGGRLRSADAGGETDPATVISPPAAASRILASGRADFHPRKFQAFIF